MLSRTSIPWQIARRTSSPEDVRRTPLNHVSRGSIFLEDVPLGRPRRPTGTSSTSHRDVLEGRCVTVAAIKELAVLVEWLVVANCCVGAEDEHASTVRFEGALPPPLATPAAAVRQSGVSTPRRRSAVRAATGPRSRAESI